MRAINNPTKTYKGFLGTGISLILIGIMLTLMSPPRTWLVEPVPATMANRTARPLNPAPEAPPIYINTIDPAAALTNGKQTLYLFYSTDVCAVQYCLNPSVVAADLTTKFGTGLDFVVVTTHAIPFSESRHHLETMPFDNWNIYLVEPYVSWLPHLTDTQFGWGLAEPQLVLVAADGTTGVTVGSTADIEMAGISMADPPIKGI